MVEAGCEAHAGDRFGGASFDVPPRHEPVLSTT